MNRKANNVPKEKIVLNRLITITYKKRLIEKPAKMAGNEKQKYKAGGGNHPADFTPFPMQPNLLSDEEVPKSFAADKHKLAQKDCDASWTKKNGVNVFGGQRPSAGRCGLEIDLG
jgi:hypothetical protein